MKRKQADGIESPCAALRGAVSEGDGENGYGRKIVDLPLRGGDAAGGEIRRAVARSEVWPNGQPQVGDVAEMTRQVTLRDIERFTEISGDRNPIHYDEELAKATRFGGLVVQGGVTSGILNAVVAEKLPGPGTVFLKVEWNFRAPVRPGDEITGRVEVVKSRSDKPIAELKTTVTRGDGVVALDGTALCYTMPLEARPVTNEP